MGMAGRFQTVSPLWSRTGPASRRSLLSSRPDRRGYERIFGRLACCGWKGLMVSFGTPASIHPKDGPMVSRRKCFNNRLAFFLGGTGNGSIPSLALSPSFGSAFRPGVGPCPLGRYRLGMAEGACAGTLVGGRPLAYLGHANGPLRVASIPALPFWPLGGPLCAVRTTGKTASGLERHRVSPITRTAYRFPLGWRGYPSAGAHSVPGGVVVCRKHLFCPLAPLFGKHPGTASSMKCAELRLFAVGLRPPQDEMRAGPNFHDAGKSSFTARFAWAITSGMPTPW